MPSSRFSISLFSITLLSLAAPINPSHATLSVAGAGSVRVPHTAALTPTSGVTIEAWVRRNDAGRCETIVGKNFQRGLWLGFCPNKIRFYPNADNDYVEGISDVPAGVWTHIAVTYDRTTVRLYRDGMLDGAVTHAGSLPSNIDDLAIGADSDGRYGFDGRIANVRIWSRVRSLDEIRSTLDELIGSPQPGLIAAWQLDYSPRDRFRNHDGETSGAVNFRGREAPVFGRNPISMPRLARTPTLDGRCLVGEYDGALELPYWTGTPFSVENHTKIYVGATTTDIWVCVSNANSGFRNDDFFSVYVDPDGDGGAFAKSEDFRVRIDRTTGTRRVDQGNVSGNYTPRSVGGNAAMADWFEFSWDVEFRIPRSQITGETFGLQFLQHWIRHTGDDYGWPVDFDWNSPDAWPLFTFETRPRFELDFSPICGRVLNHPLRSRMRETVDCTLTTSLNDSPYGVQAWSISVGSVGVDITDIRFEGTEAHTYYDGSGWLHAETTSGPGNEGAICAIVLSFARTVTLPSEGTITIAELDIEAPVPCCGDRRAARLFYVDGRQGPGQPVNNTITFFEESHDPILRGCDFTIAGELERFRRSDVDGSGATDLSDAVRILNWLFLGSSEPTCLEAADSDDNGVIELTDSVLILAHLFQGTAKPAQPYPDCGSAPQQGENLGCEQAGSCN